MALLPTLLFLAVVALATAAQSLTGFAFALILVGLAGVFELAPLPDAVNVATVLSLASAFVALRGARKWIDLQMLRDTSMGSLLGVVAGVLLLGWLSTNVVALLRVLLGLTVIGCALVVFLRSEALAQRSPRLSFAATGLLSGVLGGMFASSGPPLVWQFYRQPLALLAIRETLVATLAVGGVMRLLLVVPAGGFSRNALMLSLLAAPLVMGLTWLLRRHPPAWSPLAIRKLVCVLLLLTGAGLVAPALRAALP
ncbi:TSUP family transporter [uncultured Ramlibacter sp.]|uniref:TSUP family transporter n=1 Tax=uncultured Ramlibacter sp. TaxID=260755 RepID=UPI002620C2D4|nr:TSUP family transporter [uncultured Ramlibacter sp.]